MTIPKIAIIAAMPEEIRPLVRAFQARRVDRDIYRGTCADYEIIIARSGMGGQNARRTAEKVIAAEQPVLLVSCGVGGGVRPGLKVGDVVIASTVMSLTGKLAPCAGTIRVPPARNDILYGTFVTTVKIENKETVHALLPPECANPVVEMETAAILEPAARAGIPLIGVRGISDDALEELQFSLEEFTDKDLNLRIERVVAAVLRRPWIIPQLLRLAKNTNLAAANAAAVVKAIVEKESLPQTT